ncbi:MAG: hypothetical protein NW237_02405 [Cyanobacteriota bacterium]|nr:hypothetical protein [Cyanobacteriota bacterium]
MSLSARSTLTLLSWGILPTAVLADRVWAVTAPEDVSIVVSQTPTVSPNSQYASYALPPQYQHTGIPSTITWSSLAPGQTAPLPAKDLSTPEDLPSHPPDDLTFSRLLALAEEQQIGEWKGERLQMKTVLSDTPPPPLLAQATPSSDVVPSSTPGVTTDPPPSSPSSDYMEELLRQVRQKALNKSIPTSPAPPTQATGSPPPASNPIPPIEFTKPGIPSYPSAQTPPQPGEANLIQPADAPVILTPSLEQNQPSSLSTEPTFTAPAISDLPTAALNTPAITDQLLQPQPFLGQLRASDITPPLQRDALVPFPEVQPIASNPAPPPTLRQANLSPLQRPMTRLFGFETAEALQQNELMLSVGGSSFSNPADFRSSRGAENRSNDVRFVVDYGLTDQLQITAGVENKDDTFFRNVVRDGQDLYFDDQGFSAQVKWQIHKGEKLSFALVGGAKIPNANLVTTTFSAERGFSSPARKVYLRTNNLSQSNELLATDDSIHFSLAAPISYQLTSKARLHLNPQISVFPDSLPASILSGDPDPFLEADIGFDGERLDYYGTVAGLGLGFDYDFAKFLQFSADYTPILTGQNSADASASGSLFIGRPVWNAGVRFSPNSRLGVNLYLTNRYGPIAASPSNLLAQPAGDTAVGLDFVYLPDLLGKYSIVKRQTYPNGSAFLSQLNSFPSTTLPLDGIIYELDGGPNRFNQTIRYGLLDDLELVLHQSFLERSEDPSFEFERDLLGRLAVIPDRGKPGLSASITAGLLTFRDTSGSPDSVPTGYALYGDVPLRLQPRHSNVTFSMTPKLVIPAQYIGIDDILGVTLGTTWKLGETTELMGQYTPIISGQNQLIDSEIPGQSLAIDSSVSLYTIGVRQLVPSGNSLYAVDLYVGNSAGQHGFGGITGLPNGENQVGLRFSILNGVPASQADSPKQP